MKTETAKGTKKLFKLLLALLVFLASVHFIWHFIWHFIRSEQFDFSTLLHSLGRLSVGWIIVLIGLQVLTMLLVNLQWHKIASSFTSTISFWDMFYINCQGAVMDSITPGVKIGGEITRAVKIKKLLGFPHGISSRSITAKSITAKSISAQSASIVAIQKMFSISTLIFINLFALGYLFSVPFFIYFIMIIFLIVFLYLLFFPNRILPDAGLLTKNTKMSLLLLSLAIWLLYPVKMYLLTVQIAGPSVSLIYVGSVAFVAYVVAMIPIFPGGLGGFEGTMTLLLLAANFLPPDALVITLLFRFFTFWLVMLFSAGFIMFCFRIPVKAT